MVGNVSQFTLQPMANQNHKFQMREGGGGGGGGGGAQVFHVKYITVLANLNSHQLRVLCSLSH